MYLIVGGYFVVVALCVALHYALIQLVEKLSLTSKRHRMIQVGQPAFWARVRLVAYSGCVPSIVLVNRDACYHLLGTDDLPLALSLSPA